MDEKNGFRIYKLGTPLSQFDSSTIEEASAYVKTDMRGFWVKTFDPKLGDATIDSIQLDFLQDLLQSVRVGVKGQESQAALKAVLIKAYGQPDTDYNIIDETLTWNGTDCTLQLSLSSTDASATAVFTSKSVDAKIKKITEDKAKAGAASGVQNL